MDKTQVKSWYKFSFETSTVLNSLYRVNLSVEAP
jgi:hypothetical protein